MTITLETSQHVGHYFQIGGFGVGERGGGGFLCSGAQQLHRDQIDDHAQYADYDHWHSRHIRLFWKKR